MSSKKSKNPSEQVHVIQDVDGKPLIVEDFYNDLVLVFFGDNKHSLQELLERLKEQDPTFRETTRGEAENPNANSDDGAEDANNSNSQTADDVKNYLKRHVHQAATFIYLNPAAVDWLVMKIFWNAGTRLSVMLFRSPHSAKQLTSAAKIGR